jgi:hypothetical protein
VSSEPFRTTLDSYSLNGQTSGNSDFRRKLAQVLLPVFHTHTRQHPLSSASSVSVCICLRICGICHCTHFRAAVGSNCANEYHSIEHVLGSLRQHVSKSVGPMSMQRNKCTMYSVLHTAAGCGQCSAVQSAMSLLQGGLLAALLVHACSFRRRAKRWSSKKYARTMLV